jgi:hypothetical protein
MTQNNLYMHDFDALPFLQNVVKSKLTEAQQHLKKLEVYRAHPERLNIHILDDIMSIHEENNEFMTRVYNQCKLWRNHTVFHKYSDKISHLETLAKTLETTVYHVLYCSDQIQKKAIADVQLSEES